MCRLWKPTWCSCIWVMSYTTWVIAVFVLKCANFRYHGNRGRSEQFLTITFKQADPYNSPTGCKYMGYISYVRGVMANFVLKFEIFRYHGNGVGLSKFVWHSQMCRLRISHMWCRCLGYMPYAIWVIAIFVLKFANFRYHGNRDRSEQFLTVTFKQADPQDTLLGASTWVISLK